MKIVLLSKSVSHSKEGLFHDDDDDDDEEERGVCRCPNKISVNVLNVYMYVYKKLGRYPACLSEVCLKRNVSSMDCGRGGCKRKRGAYLTVTYFFLFCFGYGVFSM